jgi:hypothetical protein
LGSFGEGKRGEAGFSFPQLASRQWFNGERRIRWGKCGRLEGFGWGEVMGWSMEKQMAFKGAQLIFENIYLEFQFI